MTIINCINCKWSAPVLLSHDDGSKEIFAYECRHNAPSIGGWPLVEAGDWCGEAYPKGVE
jgi:hypothetical protein